MFTVGLFTILALFLATAAESGVYELLEKSQNDISNEMIIAELIKSVNDLKIQNSKQQAMMEDMQVTVLRQREDMNKMKEQLSICEAIMDVKSDPQTKPGESRGRLTRQAAASTVAFSAVAANSVSHYGAANKSIRFEKVELNTGNAYDPSIGIFTAPFAGIYVISATILSVASRETSCDIVVNGNARARLYARGTDDRHGQGSQTVLYRLDAGDVVSVQNEAIDDAVHGGMYTTFSGFLLPEESAVTNIIG